jgi:hypothetical protein
MSREALDQLRDSVTEAEQARDEAADTIAALQDRLDTLPGAGAATEEIERAYRGRAIRHCLIVVVLAAVAFGLYRGLLHPRTSFTTDAESNRQREIERLKAETEKLAGPEVEEGLHALVQIYRDASYPAALGQAGGRSPYPALHQTGPEEFTMHPTKDDGVWRWVNIGVAACTVDDKRWSSRATDALNWLSSPTDNLGLPIQDYLPRVSHQGNPVAREGLSVMLAHCFMAGQLSLSRDRPTPSEMAENAD